MIEINRNHRIFIFADRIQNKGDTEVVSISDYDVDLTGTEMLTSSLQNALNELSGTDKVLKFPAGIYKTGSLSIKSNSQIHSAPGPILRGPDEVSDLDTEEHIRPRCFILIRDAENVEISGRGIIDGNGRHLRDIYADEGRGWLLKACRSQEIPAPVKIWRPYL